MDKNDKYKYIIKWSPKSRHCGATAAFWDTIDSSNRSSYAFPCTWQINTQSQCQVKSFSCIEEITFCFSSNIPLFLHRLLHFLNGWNRLWLSYDRILPFSLSLWRYCKLWFSFPFLCNNYDFKAEFKEKEKERTRNTKPPFFSLCCCIFSSHKISLYVNVDLFVYWFRRNGDLLHFSSFFRSLFRLSSNWRWQTEKALIYIYRSTNELLMQNSNTHT